MKPQRIILVRHGESEGNVDREKYSTIPDHALRLTQTGREQAAEAGKKILEITEGGRVHGYCSPYARTRETCKPFVDAGVNFVRMFEDPRLREQDWGHLRSPDETKKIQDDRYKFGTFYFRFPDGESGADVFDRVSGFLDTLHRDFESVNYPENALIITHGLTIRLFLMRWFHSSIEEFELWDNPSNCQIFVMKLRQNDGLYSMPEMPRVARA